MTDGRKKVEVRKGNSEFFEKESVVEVVNMKIMLENLVTKLNVVNGWIITIQQRMDVFEQLASADVTNRASV